MRPQPDSRVKFDHDLRRGQEGENFLLLLNAADGLKVEVKSEQDIWMISGNMFFEFSYRGKKSGIAATEAKIWHCNLVWSGRIVGYMGFDVEILKHNLRRLVKEKKVKIITGGDNNWSQGILVPISLYQELVEPISKT